MLEIAKKEEKPFINDLGQPDFIPLDERSITKWQIQFMNYLKDNNLSDGSINTIMAKFRASFNHFHIQLPNNIRLKTPKKILMGVYQLNIF